MKLERKITSALPANNEQTLLMNKGAKIEQAGYLPLLQLLAQLCDEIANGAQMYAIIGATSKRDSLVITVKLNNEPTSVYAPDLLGLSGVAETLL